MDHQTPSNGTKELRSSCLINGQLRTYVIFVYGAAIEGTVAVDNPFVAIAAIAGGGIAEVSDVVVQVVVAVLVVCRGS